MANYPAPTEPKPAPGIYREAAPRAKSKKERTGMSVQYIDAEPEAPAIRGLLFAVPLGLLLWAVIIGTVVLALWLAGVR